MLSSYDVNDKNYLLLAMKAYNSTHLVLSEFESDIKRVKYIKRLIRQYKVSKDLKERLILNHIIILANVFGVEFTTKMLFYRIDPEDWDVLKVFLLYLHYLPNQIDSINGEIIRTTEIPLDQHSIDVLRKESKVTHF